jgi:hypothetical protein
MTSSRRGLKVLVLLVAVLVLGIASLALWIRTTADQRWAAAQERIRQLSAAHPVAIPPMPAGRPKELQIHLVAAIKDAARTNARGAEAADLVARREINDAVTTVLDEARDFLDRLHEGARACAAAPGDSPPGWRGEWDPDTIRYMMNCGVLRARLQRKLLATGDPVETLLDCVQLGRFWTISGRGDSWVKTVSALEAPLQEFREVLSRDALSSEVLRRVDSELENFEAAIPPVTHALEGRLATWAEALPTAPPAAAGFRWRYVLPDALMRAEALEFCDRQVQRLREAEVQSYSDLVAEFLKLQERLEDSKNPLLRSGIDLSPDWNLGHARAWVRLLRTAARYRATGEILTLKDPMGGTLLHARSGSRMKFWSLGIDGLDGGGAEAGDFVIEVDPPKPE